MSKIYGYYFQKAKIKKKKKKLSLLDHSIIRPIKRREYNKSLEDEKFSEYCLNHFRENDGM